MKRLISWLDQNILTLLTAILIIVIPLYPKLPLADLIEGYIVRARLEDVLILFTGVIWLVQLWRKKLELPQNLITKAIYAYIVIGFLSSLSAIFITHTVTLDRAQLLKIALHFLRRIEYFSLFFITYTSVRSKQDFSLFIKIAVATLLGVVFYGLGQKYLYWPAFSTMNREFSKGMRLYLTPSSRLMSTFGGHYDYAAYLMMLLTLSISGFWITQNKLIKLALAILMIPTYWSLILTASRTSFLGYLTGLTVVAVMLGKAKGKLKMFFNWLLVVALSMTVMLTMGDLSERFFQILEQPDILVHEITQVTPIQRDTLSKFMDQTKGTLLSLRDSLQIFKDKMNNFKFTAPPKNSISTDELANKVTVSSDTLPVVVKPDLPPDVTQAEDDLRTRLESEKVASTSTETVPPPPTSNSGYSPNALKYGLSVAIRLDALWPRAIAGFKRNPLLGIGYSTLTKATVEEFTYAESSDNDYLRMLGETGLLGTLSFFAILVIALYYSWRIYQLSTNPLEQAIAVGTIGAIVALLVNATYIDIFESSKIAYSLWILVALVVKLYDMQYLKADHAKKNK